MNKEEELLQKRLLDLSNRAQQRGIPLYSDFLNLNELNIYYQTNQKFSCHCRKTFGGYEFAERRMVAFIPDAFSFREDKEVEEEFPITCLRIIPLHEKFAETLNHRDFLGALMNLGIDRSKTGDILVKDKEAVLICHKSMESFICQELTRIRNTAVSCTVQEFDMHSFSPKIECIKGNVASLRLDALVALAFGTSRGSILPLIEGGKVFVNGRLVTSNGHTIKEEEVISVRGHGRFRYKQIVAQTKKGRYFVELEKYI